MRRNEGLIRTQCAAGALDWVRNQAIFSFMSGLLAYDGSVFRPVPTPLAHALSYSRRKA